MNENNTKTVEKTHSVLSEKNLSTHEIRDISNSTEPNSKQAQDKVTTQLDGHGSSIQDNELNSSITATDSFGMEFAALDSPPKFIIPKVGGDELPSTSKKGFIVETMLQEKNLCFAVEEVLKGHNSAGVEAKSAKRTNKGSHCTFQETSGALVLRDSEENDQVPTANIKEIPKVTQSDENNVSGAEMETSSESSSEIDSEIEGEILGFGLNNEQGNKKKKEININNVVQSLTERKNSVDEIRETKRYCGTKSNALILDDSNDECSNLLINESGDSSNESKRISSKSDTRRRKGIPAKVCNRSSTSTETTASSTEIKSKDDSEVLDEVNGKFRRSSEDSDVTIMLVTENVSPQKDTPTQVRSVNISKSLSISVVNKTSADLVMEGLDSDFVVQNTTGSSSNNLMVKPTARKTFPSNPKAIDISDSTRAICQNKPNESHPPPLINLRDQTKVYEINKLKNATPSTGSKTPVSKASIGPVSAKLEEVTEKMKEKFQSLFEEMLRECSESGNLESTIVSLKVEKERMMWRQRQEIAELKHNADLQISENRATSDADKQRALLDAKHRYEFEKEQAVNEAKRKQWCMNCQKEAVLYCCWNTSYCCVACQQHDWANHMGACSNKQHEENTPGVSGNVEANRLGSSSGQLHEHVEVEGVGRGRRRKVRRCGQCPGCLTSPCGQCYNCTNPNSHSVCKNRRCSLILTQKKQWRMRPQDRQMPRLTPKPGYLPPNPQIMRRNEHLMPPPPAPPPYHHIFRPNQVYTVPPVQFIHHNMPPAYGNLAPFCMGLP